MIYFIGNIRCLCFQGVGQWDGANNYVSFNVSDFAGDWNNWVDSLKYHILMSRTKLLVISKMVTNQWNRKLSKMQLSVHITINWRAYMKASLMCWVLFVHWVVCQAVREKFVVWDPLMNKLLSCTFDNLLSRAPKYTVYMWYSLRYMVKVLSNLLSSIKLCYDC